MAEQQLTEAFVEMADTLVDDFDLMAFLHVLTDRCVSLLGVSAAGLLLTDQRGALRLVAASSEQTRLLELFQVQIDEGPCLECFHSGQPVAVADLADAAQQWPRFVPAARRTGFEAVHALPMRLPARSSARSTCSPRRPRTSARRPSGWARHSPTWPPSACSRRGLFGGATP
jgi:GAF domain